MGEKSKKRQKSRSSSRSGSHKKRLRTTSSSLSRDSAQQDANAFPTNEDYSFRLSVICSTEFDDKVFTKAVEGLVQICFPDAVLDQIGVDVIAAHMEQGGAPQNNIDKMRKVFDATMIHRVSWMLAKYLDTPEKLDQGVSAVVDASQALYGQKLTTSGVRDSVEQRDIASVSSPSEVTPPKKAEKNKTRKKLKHRLENNTKASRPKVLTDNDDSESDMALKQKKTAKPAKFVNKKAATDKEKKVSASWRWDIDPSMLDPKAISDCFQRISDLFAYHALPVVERELGPAAEKKAIRKKIESVLVDMHDKEYSKWVDSFDRLQRGDATMLERVSPRDISNEKDIARATPAPASVRHRRERRLEAHHEGAPRTQQNALGAGFGEVLARSGVGSLPPVIKHETTTNIEPAEATANRTEHKPDGKCTIQDACRHLSAEEPRPVARDSVCEPPRNVPFTDNLRDGQFSIDTPIIELLLGKSKFELSEKARVVQELMSNLDKRVAAPSVGIPQFNGGTVVQTKGTLVHILKQSFGTTERFHEAKVRRILETHMIPWVIPNFASFPELLLKPFLFVFMMPYATPVTDTFCPPNLSLAAENKDVAKDHIWKELARREIDPVGAFYPYSLLTDVIWKSHYGLTNESLAYQLAQLLGTRSFDAVPTIKRLRIERVLRWPIFEHWCKSPELKSSPLVREWERITGQRW